MEPDVFVRARSAEAKRIREDAILSAASSLALNNGVRSATLTDIAKAAGMHKSSLLRYFETREEIFLHLADRHWHEWSQQVQEQLEVLGRAKRDDTVQKTSQVTDVLTETLMDRPLFCDLLAQTPLNLERGVSFDAVRSFKVRTLAEASAIGSALCNTLGLNPHQASDVIVTATSMAGALWQMAAPGTDLRRFYKSDPDLTHAIVDVKPRLAGIMNALLHGYCEQNQSR